MPKIRPKVFLDANVVIQGGKPPGGPLISRVADLVNAGLIKVLTTDLTVAEVAKKHAENDYEVIKEVGRPHFRNLVKEHLGIDLPNIHKAELRASISKRYTELVEAMFTYLRAKTLGIDNVKPSKIFVAYTERSGFFTGEGKKDQFPDAFIFECLKAEASAKSPVIIVSNDGDFHVPVKGVEHISLLKTIPDLFQSLGLQVEAPEIEEFLEENEEELIELVDKEISDWGLQVSDVEDAEIEESTVTAVELTGLISFGSLEQGGSILVVGNAEITVTVSYTHPNWDEAMYDSEDKVLIPFDDVSGETEVVMNADFSMSITVDDNGEPAEIEEFQFRDSDFVYVELYSDEIYK
jgi:hypothetical protein